MRSAKLFILGEERELLWTYMDYYKHIAADGSPTSDMEGGLLRLCFVSQESDDVFWHNMVKKVDKETERMEKGEIHFYSKGDEDIPIRKYKFSDAYLIALSETFYAYGTENMQTVLTISPAIQNYGFEYDLVKHWQVSKIPTTPVYYTPKKEKKQTRVKTIERITPLDFGSDNDGKETQKQEGMLYGKEYEFKVTEYTEQTPDDKSQIKWAIKYHSLSQNKWIEKKSSVTGDTLKFFLNEKDMCGRFVYFRAYIQDAESEGELKVWKHNRFRWFDRKQLKDEVEERKTKPYLANQKNTSLCGMAAIMYLLAKQDHTLYKKFILDLHRTGYYKFNNYIVDVSKKSMHLLSMNPITNVSYPKDYKGKMPYCDWISFSSIRDQENNVRDFDGEDDFSFDGATLPNEIKKLMAGILGYFDIVDNTNMIFNKGTLPWDGEDSSSREIAKMEELHFAGYNIIMFVNTNMIKQRKEIINGKILLKTGIKSGIESTIEHWIVFDSIIGGTINWDEYDFKVFTWGEMRDIIINPEIFSTNYYGFVYGK